MMLVKSFCVAFVAAFFVVVAALPWAVAYEGWHEHDPAQFGLAMVFGLLEIAMIADLAMGYA